MNTIPTQADPETVSLFPCVYPTTAVPRDAHAPTYTTIRVDPIIGTKNITRTPAGFLRGELA